ncbi:hypothetical protein [Nocardia sp. NPDC060259]|uniref:hypothetical protein n=1 Tax=Nocardia sp. NPDC060259 TaxID=3347088 RepID=UPI0036521CDA
MSDPTGTVATTVFLGIPLGQCITRNARADMPRQPRARVAVRRPSDFAAAPGALAVITPANPDGPA